jgi:hypothetical protein
MPPDQAVDDAEGCGGRLPALCRQLAAFDPLEAGAAAAGADEELSFDDDDEDEPLEEEALSDEAEDLRLSVR